MCIIAYKPENKSMIDYDTLKTMFEHNSDGAGFMFTKNNKVHIQKGYMTFKAFYKALKKYKSEWYDQPFVLHFRISTQAGVNQACCHPFPLSDDMAQLKKLHNDTDMGIAHNGIISLTSSYSKTATHSDTMEFITDYLSLIIKDKNYYKHKNTVELIKRLAESKLAILDNKGHCELIGNFVKDNGIYYSNESYKPRTYLTVNNGNGYKSYTRTYYDTWDDYDYTDYYYNSFKKDVWDAYNTKTDKYEFDDLTCPGTCYGVTEFCTKCVNYNKCYAV